MVKFLEGPFAPGEFRQHAALLVEGRYAFHIDPLYGELWIDHVKQIAPDTYLKSWESSGAILTKGVTLAQAEETMRRIYRDLNEMRAFDFVVRALMPQGIDVDMYAKEDGQ